MITVRFPLRAGGYSGVVRHTIQEEGDEPGVRLCRESYPVPFRELPCLPWLKHSPR